MKGKGLHKLTPCSSKIFLFCIIKALVSLLKFIVCDSAESLTTNEEVNHFIDFNFIRNTVCGEQNPSGKLTNQFFLKFIFQLEGSQR